MPVGQLHVIFGKTSIHHIALFSVIAAALALLAGGCTAVLSLYSPTWFWLPIALLALVILGLVVLLICSKRLYTGWLGRLIGALDADQQAALQRFPLPALMLSSDGDILYANDCFISQITDGTCPIYSSSVQRVFGELDSRLLAEKRTIEVTCAERKYTAYISVISRDKDCRYAVYFVDNTDLKDIAEEYAASRPAVLQVCIDNLEETTEHLRTKF